MSTTIRSTILRTVSSVAVALALVACGTTPGPQPTVESVVIDGGDRVVAIGGTVQLDATVTVSGGASTDVTWSTDAPDIATVSASGQVEGIAAGVATITATSVADTSVRASIDVEVSAVPTSLTIDQGDAITLDPGESRTLTVTVQPTGASNSVTWTSDDETAVSVTDGVITAVGVDATAVVTAVSTLDPTLSADITVTVNALPAPDPNEIFVDSAAEAGGNGSAAFPFQTINDGIDAVADDGIVRVAAGTYDESLYIDKPLQLLGAGVGSVTIVSDDDAPGVGSTGSINVRTVSGLTLSGFTLDVRAPGPTFAAIAFPYANGSSNVTIEDVEVLHTNDGRTTRGIALFDSSDVTLRNVDITAKSVGGDTGHQGAGVSIVGESSTIVLDDVTTTGHESFAGVLLRPGDVDATISGVTITGASTFNEINKMTVDETAGGVITSLDADQFVVAVSNLAVGGGASVYGQGDRYFYKTDVQRAILDALFNFNEEDGAGVQAWIRSVVQPLDDADESDRLNSFVLGSRFDDTYGFGVERSLFLQAAVDAAEAGAVLTLQAGTFAGADEPFAGGIGTVDGAVVVDVDDVTISGAGATSIVSADVGPVFTIDAANVTIANVQIDGPPGVDGIVIGSGDQLDVSASNLLTDVAIDNSADATVTAVDNWWGATDGPGGDGPGSGSAIIDPVGGGDVSYVPWALSAF